MYCVDVKGVESIGNTNMMSHSIFETIKKIEVQDIFVPIKELDIQLIVLSMER